VQEASADWSNAVSIALYRIVQEGLTNVLRHSTATEVKVKITEQDEQVLLTLADNGRYDEDPHLNFGFGTKGMVERAKALGGSCAFLKNEDGGLTIRAVLPMNGG